MGVTNASWDKTIFPKFCSKSGKHNQSIKCGGEEGGTNLGKEIRDQFGTCALILSAHAIGPEKTSRETTAMGTLGMHIKHTPMLLS